ncbi:mannitol dehydrogenase family protein [Microbulbifer magnicolonia]|uniref:mannitol dehydrogenase family protein n=1 Tax=Microbulbifer magnicolonia TaxID=3109744 RepID=UPI002B4123D8|nr:mannitol dehydrogenase family protein [Microbulbifer sp. GG15]
MQRLSLELMNSDAFEDASRVVRRPGYNPENLNAGIVHIGIGNFHRAHQAVYVDDLLAKSGEDWRITAISLRKPDMRDRMQLQDCLYTLCESCSEGEHLRVIGSVESVLVAPENPSAVIDALASENTYVVTVTVTEKGYYLIPGEWELDLANPDIAADIADSESPKTLFGFLLAACKLRRERGQRGFSILSCDNLPENGGLLKSCLLAVARLKDQSLAYWIEENLGFCSTMVDCMVPATTVELVKRIQSDTGYRDMACLQSEAFRQWVIEDNFVTKCPDWRAVGVMVVEDVAPFERMKLRLLNGSHSALAYMGRLLDYNYIHEAVGNELLQRFVVALMRRELMATLAGVEGVDLPRYCEQVLARFANPAIPYTCMQVASDSSQKLAQRLLQPANELNALGRPCPMICVVIAAWLAFLFRSRCAGKETNIGDPGAAGLIGVMQKLGNMGNFPSDNHVRVLLMRAGVVPAALLSSDAFVVAVARALGLILKEGVEATLAAALRIEAEGV